jgi:hypothetical protein
MAVPANHRIKSKAEVADEYAFQIEAAMHQVILSQGKSLGPARELRNLAAAARRAIARKDAASWAHTWATLPSRTRWMVWQEPETMPTAAMALDKIASALKLMASVPASERRRLKRSKRVEALAVEAIRFAFWELTDHRSGRIVGRDGQLTGPLIDLCREIDRIFGTRLFAGADSWRLR